MSSIQRVVVDTQSSNQVELSSEKSFNADLRELKSYLDSIHNNPDLLHSDKFQNSIYSFMQKFANDFNQLPENERKSSEMKTLIEDLAQYGLVDGNTDGISVSPYQSQFSNALDGLVMPGQKKVILTILDPAILAAMRK